MARKTNSRPVRYAVAGLGYIAQSAVLPAFENAKRNSRLVALFSDDPEKRRKLGRKYGIQLTFDYDAYDDVLRGGEIDAVYIALPNNLHHDYTLRAARAGVHVLCEKPMAVTVDECEDMIEAAETHRVKLMIAYRLHFESANLRAIEMVRTGMLGEPRIFDSVFANPTHAPDIRLESELGGGTLYDIGIYCINAARYLFREEPFEVSAFTASVEQKRFEEVEEMAGAVLRFPDARLATFVSSFGAAPWSDYRVFGTKGSLALEKAYEIQGEKTLRLTVNEKTREKTFAGGDQFAPELIHFSDCILTGKQPAPSGHEGLADVRIIRALYESARKHEPVKLPKYEIRRRPKPDQEIKRPPVKEPRLVNAASPSGD
jgi:glucose-fructose oxidoreductase